MIGTNNQSLHLLCGTATDHSLLGADLPEQMAQVMDYSIEIVDDFRYY